MAVRIGHASISENGTIRGTAGDQTKKEVCIRNWYKHSKGWVLLRCNDPAMRDHIATAAEHGAANDLIGYDQIENQTLWNNVKDKGFDPGKADKPVETDCARFVRVCAQYACEQVGNGKTIPDFYTATLKNTLVKTGLFTAYTASKYVNQSNLLLRGDILVTATKGHTCIVLDNGSDAKAEAAPSTPKNYKLGDRIIKDDMEGEDVKEIQRMLISLGYDLSVTSEYDDATEIAVRNFQKAKKLDIDGEVGPMTIAALETALEKEKEEDPVNATQVKIFGGKAYIRSEPSKTKGKVIGTAKPGDIYEYAGEQSVDGWNKIKFDGKEGWVSGKYSKLDGVQYVQIVNGNCNIRIKPSTSGSILGTARNGQEYVYAGETTNGWMKIRYKNEKTGWVSGAYSKMK